jgi:tRNA pseudouridine38-40 synthase
MRPGRLLPGNARRRNEKMVLAIMSITRNIKITLEYDGTLFNGFQKQIIPGTRTVQNELESALNKILGEKIKTTVAGRTDTGVHALAQVVNFKTHSHIALTDLRRALNALLPDSIAALEVEEVDDYFHARFSAEKRCYHYYVLNREIRSALGRFYLCHIKKQLDMEKMRDAAHYLEGEKDFTSFSTSIKETRSTVRRLDSIKILKGTEVKGLWSEMAIICPTSLLNDLVVFEFIGNGFLRSMVRMMVAVLLRAGLGKLPPQEVEIILKKRDPRLVNNLAPAAGLFLINIEYKEGYSHAYREIIACKQRSFSDGGRRYSMTKILDTYEKQLEAVGERMGLMMAKAPDKDKEQLRKMKKEIDDFAKQAEEKGKFLDRSALFAAAIIATADITDESLKNAAKEYIEVDHLFIKTQKEEEEKKAE